MSYAGGTLGLSALPTCRRSNGSSSTVPRSCGRSRAAVQVFDMSYEIGVISASLGDCGDNPGHSKSNSQEFSRG